MHNKYSESPAQTDEFRKLKPLIDGALNRGCCVNSGRMTYVTLARTERGITLLNISKGGELTLAEELFSNKNEVHYLEISRANKWTL